MPQARILLDQFQRNIKKHSKNTVPIYTAGSREPIGYAQSVQAGEMYGGLAILMAPAKSALKRPKRTSRPS
jgi:hypothetical protein